MATINDLFIAFGEFQASVNALNVDEEYELGLWADGSGELVDVEWGQVTRWKTFDEGIEKLNELTARNEAAQS